MMRRVFFSFHYEKDNWRVSQLKNIGKIAGNPIAHTNDWESIKREGNTAIKNWINKNLEGRTCLITCIGEETSEREWVLYEIQQAWNKGIGVCGVYIHNLKDSKGNTSKMGENPFEKFCFEKNNLPSFMPPTLQYNPLLAPSAYAFIEANLAGLIEQAIEYRKGKEQISRNVRLLP